MQEELAGVVKGIRAQGAGGEDEQGATHADTDEAKVSAVPEGSRRRTHDSAALSSNPLNPWQVLRRLGRHDIKTFAEVATARLPEDKVVRFAACALTVSKNKELHKAAKVCLCPGRSWSTSNPCHAAL
jgi:hypothetical protein